MVHGNRKRSCVKMSKFRKNTAKKSLIAHSARATFCNLSYVKCQLAFKLYHSSYQSYFVSFISYFAASIE